MTSTPVSMPAVRFRGATTRKLCTSLPRLSAISSAKTRNRAFSKTFVRRLEAIPSLFGKSIFCENIFALNSVGTGKANSVTVHKKNSGSKAPLISVILLDWSCRERFHALDWLAKQTVPREQYELIWVELFDRVVTQALDGADVLITCGQKGTYHKHRGYNIALLESRGKIITVCDSDAVFPPNFIESIITSFRASDGDAERLVLMHYEWRTDAEYPALLTRMEDLSAFQWKELWPNVGACVSVQRIDAVRFGGFDEHPSYRGFICGPYDL